MNEATIENLSNDPSTSFWLKAQLEQLSQRDVVDFLHDVELLMQVLQKQLHDLEKAHIGKRQNVLPLHQN